MKEPIIEAEQLDQSHIHAVANGECAAVRIKEFYDRECAQALGEVIDKWLSEDSWSQSSIYETNLKTLSAVLGDEYSKDRYFENSIEFIHRLRNLCAPWVTPADLVRLELDELWPAGATLMALKSGTAAFGMPRVWRSGVGSFPHQDLIRRFVDHNEHLYGLGAQLGLNVYLSECYQGGELAVWDYVVSDEAAKEYQKVQGYGFDANDLPAPAVELSFKSGDLSVVNTEKVHTIRKVESGNRITLSGFCLVNNTDDLLYLWS